jgi:N-acetylneuraminic acid mutarotase
LQVDGDTVFRVPQPKIYHFSGSDGSNIDDIYEYDAATDTISTSSATVPQNIRLASAAAVDGKIYHLGGATDSCAPLDDIYEYDPATDTISTTSATLPQDITLATAAAVDGKIYHFGGFDGNSEIDDIYEYDPATDSISTMSATLPQNIRFATAAVVG